MSPDTAAAPATRCAPPLIALREVCKRFGGIRALDGADLQISAAGTVHGLIGENGSGKSTMLSILSGQLRPDSGTLHLRGRPLDLPNTTAALARGIAMVSQETAVAPRLSVAENVLLGRRLVRTARGIDWPATYRRAGRVLAQLGLDYDPRQQLATLRPDQRQMVEIARALSLEAQLLILDEPTSSLTDDEVDDLFAAVRRLRADGVSVLFVSHRLGELFEISDELTVLRDGRTVAAGPAGDFTPDTLVAAMVGPTAARLHDLRGTRAALPPEIPDSLAVRGLSDGRAFVDVDMSVKQGEIVGVAGLVGAGRSELLATIFGDRPAQSGTVRLLGLPYARRTPRASISRGMGLLPPDRATQGVVLQMSTRANATMIGDSRKRRLSRPRTAREAARVTKLFAAMRMRGSAVDVPVRQLSGGNQQKVALAKWLDADARVLLLDEPTRGVDVTAKAEIHDLIRAAADSGVAALVSSSDNSELLDLCHRILVMYRGRVVASLPRAQADEQLISTFAGGRTP